MVEKEMGSSRAKEILDQLLNSTKTTKEDMPLILELVARSLMDAPQRRRRNRDQVSGPQLVVENPPQTPPEINIKTPQTPQDRFDEFWSLYPRREAKRSAMKAFRSASKRAKVETILLGAQRYARAKKGKEKQFICLPTTWLNGDRWEDEIDTGKVLTGPWRPFKEAAPERDFTPPTPEEVERRNSLVALLKKSAEELRNKDTRKHNRNSIPGGDSDG